MHISDLFKKDKTVFSFEVFPPKKTSSLEAIYESFEELSDLKPDFISVTYGAGGNRADSKTCQIASEIQNKYGIISAAHLTCIYNSKEDVDEILKELKDHGIQNILALRGDINPDYPIKDDFKYANELISYIKYRGDFDVSGACYPEGHMESGSLENDIKNLKIKVDAGAQHLISQLFFENSSFYSFLEKTKMAGIDVPIEAGIMPVINKNQIEKMVSMCGASLPVKFSKMIQRYEHQPEALRDAGIAYAIDQIVDLISSGVDGIHLYTMNNPYVAKRINDAIRSLL